MEDQDVDKLIRAYKTKTDVDKLIRVKKITQDVKNLIRAKKINNQDGEVKRSDLWKSFRWSLSLSPSVHCGQKRHFTLTISPTEDDPSKAILGILSTLD